MKAIFAAKAFFAGFVLMAAPLAMGQGTAVSPQQLEANRKIALEFFRPGITPQERLALLHDDYIQHNPAFKKFADENKISYKEGFQRMMGGGGRGGGGGQGQAPAGGGQAARGAGGAGGAPAGNQTELVIAEGDLVTIIHKNYRPDPTAPGQFFEAFTFDIFRIKDGKLYEHWDAAVINPPAAPAATAPAPAAATGSAPAGR